MTSYWGVQSGVTKRDERGRRGDSFSPKIAWRRLRTTPLKTYISLLNGRVASRFYVLRPWCYFCDISGMHLCILLILLLTNAWPQQSAYRKQCDFWHIRLFSQQKRSAKNSECIINPGGWGFATDPTDGSRLPSWWRRTSREKRLDFSLFSSPHQKKLTPPVNPLDFVLSALWAWHLETPNILLNQGPQSRVTPPSLCRGSKATLVFARKTFTYGCV